MLAFWAPRRHQDLWVNLAAQWDSDWYLGIAEHGYTDELGTTPNTNNLAFFPLYPVLVKAVAVLTPGSRASTGLGLAVVASLIAAWGIFAVGDRLHGRRVGVLLTTLWAAFPVGAVQWMGYTESLFTACAAWALYAVLTGRWLWAAGCASLAGLTRPTGVAVAAAVTVTALLHLLRHRTLAPGSSPPPRWHRSAGAPTSPGWDCGWAAGTATSPYSGPGTTSWTAACAPCTSSGGCCGATRPRSSSW